MTFFLNPTNSPKSKLNYKPKEYGKKKKKETPTLPATMCMFNL